MIQVRRLTDKERFFRPDKPLLCMIRMPGGAWCHNPARWRTPDGSLFCGVHVPRLEPAKPKRRWT